MAECNVGCVEYVADCELECAIDVVVDDVCSLEADGVVGGTIPIGRKNMPPTRFISSSPNSPLVRFA